MGYSYEYDAIGRLTRKSASGRTLLAMAYDLISQEDISGKVTQYCYNALDILKYANDNNGTAEYTCYSDGTIRSLQNGSLYTEYAYDANRNLTGLKTMLGGATRYTYDGLNQLTKVEYPGYTEELYYDKAGNRSRRIAGGVEEYCYDPVGHLTEYTKGGTTTTFTYNNAGNLTADNRARYTYDLFNRTEKVETFDGHVQINHYDAEGLRSGIEEDGRLVQFIFREQEVVTELETEKSMTRFIRGYELIASDADSARTYYHYASDEMGSITHVVAGEDILNRYEYDAWGNLTLCEEKVENRFKFNGQQYDPVSQQYYLRARYYNPVIGRFTQEDTYRGDGLNLYAYCRNNPVYYVDPSGHFTQCMKDTYLRERERLLKEYVASGMDNDTALQRAKEDAYEAAKQAYAQNHSDNRPTVNVDDPSDRSMTRDQWNDAYRDARLEAKPVTDLLRQIHDVEQRTGMRVPDVQMQMLMNDYNVYGKLPTQEQRDTHRAAFDSQKARLISEWEQNTGLKWPEYSQPVTSRRGNIYLDVGNNYDAHELHPNAYGGPIAWWNIVPVSRGDHQSGIHTKDSVHYQAYPDLYRK